MSEQVYGRVQTNRTDGTWDDEQQSVLGIESDVHTYRAKKLWIIGEHAF